MVSDSTCSDTTFNQVANAYGFTRGQALKLTSNVCAGSEVLSRFFSEKIKVKYPGLKGRVSDAITTEHFLAYYVRNLEHGLELTPMSIHPYSDPLITRWLRSGFPATISGLESDMRKDERYKSTQRYQYEFAAVGYKVLCDFGDTQSCGLSAEYYRLSNKLGPMTIS